MMLMLMLMSSVIKAVQTLIFVKQCSIHGGRAKLILWRKKTQINDKFIPTSLFRGLIPCGRPRNRLVMMNLYFIRVFFLHNIYIYIYITFISGG